MIKSKFNFKKSSFSLTFIFILLLFYFGYTLVYLNKTPPNTYFANQPFPATTQDQLIEKISQKIDSFENSKIIFEVNDQKIEADPKTLGINFDKAKTIDNIWLKTKSANFKDEQMRKIKSLFIKTYIAPNYQVDFSKQSSSLDSLFGKYETKAKDATINFKLGQNPLISTWIKLADSQEPKLNVSLDNEKLNDLIDEIASSIEQNTVNATLRFENGKVTEFTP